MCPTKPRALVKLRAGGFAGSLLRERRFIGATGTGYKHSCPSRSGPLKDGCHLEMYRVFDSKHDRNIFTPYIARRPIGGAAGDGSPLLRLRPCNTVALHCLNIAPHRRAALEANRAWTQGTGEAERRKSGSGEFNNGHRQAYDSHVLNQDGSEQHSGPAEAAATDCRRSHSDNCSDVVLSHRQRPADFELQRQFYDSIYGYGGRLKRITQQIQVPQVAANSLQRNRIGYHSEPNTPAGDKLFILNDEPNPLTEVQQIPRMPLQNRNGFRRSISETNGFTKRLNYRHSFSADTRTMPIIRRPHKCCECITGVPADGEKRPGNNRLSSEL
ncbi:hypothetical protein EVAR_43475_1 [Eumeta japonica]|uniref:Uncharacterized protein n=1 Tax=Eumeta variegata TaxID=151549 RepID=A0A4C1YLQ2_EUMVA|nr:hypothetical protein EVAR_43475_1 [Eumeta japonica]